LSELLIVVTAASHVQASPSRHVMSASSEVTSLTWCDHVTWSRDVRRVRSCMPREFLWNSHIPLRLRHRIVYEEIYHICSHGLYDWWSLRTKSSLIWFCRDDGVWVSWDE